MKIYIKNGIKPRNTAIEFGNGNGNSNIMYKYNKETKNWRNFFLPQWQSVNKVWFDTEKKR